MRVIIVDDDKLVAMSLRTIVESDPDIEVIATGNSGEDAINLFNANHPDVLLMDIRMAGMTGLEAGESILAENPEAKILYLTTFNDDEYIAKALTIGAKGYIIKQDFDSIIPSLKAVYGGQSVFGNEVTEKLPRIILGSGNASGSGNAGDGSGNVKAADSGLSGNDMGNKSGGKDSSEEELRNLGLTEQEIEVVSLVAEGLSNKEISEKLFLSEGTVRNYISNILSKLDLRDRTNLAIFYYKLCK
ncbi:MAG: response regulator transcription factor [Eubacterium sp.]|nr:response regulator transcription factor [Eubacterium sp.]